MARYTVAQVENLTGISAHTLRVWERRYKFLNPERTETNIRFYSDEELKKLLNVGILIRNGHRISKVDAMPAEQINNLVMEILSSVSQENEDEINALTLAMLEMNEESFNQIFQRRLTRRGLQSTIVDLVYPFLSQVGVLWGTNKVIPAQEHFISSLIRQKVITAIDSIPVPNADAPGIVMFQLEGEDHELGLLLASYIAKDLGWRTYFLGGSVPVENIGEIMKIADAETMFSLFVTPAQDRVARQINKVLEQTEQPLLITGNRENFADLEFGERLIFLKSPEELILYLDKNRE